MISYLCRQRHCNALSKQLDVVEYHLDKAWQLLTEEPLREAKIRRLGLAGGMSNIAYRSAVVNEDLRVQPVCSRLENLADFDCVINVHDGDCADAPKKPDYDGDHVESRVASTAEPDSCASAMSSTVTEESLQSVPVQDAWTELLDGVGVDDDDWTGDAQPRLC